MASFMKNVATATVERNGKDIITMSSPKNSFGKNPTGAVNVTPSSNAYINYMGAKPRSANPMPMNASPIEMQSILQTPSHVVPRENKMRKKSEKLSSTKAPPSGNIGSIETINSTTGARKITNSALKAPFSIGDVSPVYTIISSPKKGLKKKSAKAVSPLPVGIVNVERVPLATIESKLAKKRFGKPIYTKASIAESSSSTETPIASSEKKIVKRNNVKPRSKSKSSAGRPLYTCVPSTSRGNDSDEDFLGFEPLDIDKATALQRSGTAPNERGIIEEITVGSASPGSTAKNYDDIYAINSLPMPPRSPTKNKPIEMRPADDSKLRTSPQAETASNTQATSVLPKSKVIRKHVSKSKPKGKLSDAVKESVYSSLTSMIDTMSTKVNESLQRKRIELQSLDKKIIDESVLKDDMSEETKYKIVIQPFKSSLRALEAEFQTLIRQEVENEDLTGHKFSQLKFSVLEKQKISIRLFLLTDMFLHDFIKRNGISQKMMERWKKESDHFSVYLVTTNLLMIFVRESPEDAQQILSYLKRKDLLIK